MAAARKFARLSSPIHRVGAGKLIWGIETYAAFMGGKGSGSSWDFANELKAIASFVRAPATVFDVGAHKGDWSVILQEHIGGDNRYFLFEPADYCFPGLAKNEVCLPSATIIRSAVSDCDGRKTFYKTTVGSGSSSLHERHDASVRRYDYDKIEVSTRSLDSVAKEYGIDTIDMLKLDIEGHELFALKGAGNLLSRQAIKALTFEFGSANVNSRTFFRDFWDLLTRNGFSLYRIVPGGGIARIEKYSETLEYFRGTSNYIARLD